MKTAVIVAAGLSSRLYPLTETSPKCLLPLGEEKIIERNIRLLKKAGIENIFVVTGYLKHMIEETVGEQVKTIFNPYYKFCNNMGSLYFAKNDVNNEPFLYLHGDIAFSEKLLKQFIENIDLNNLMDIAVDFKETDEEAMKVEVNENHFLVRSSKEIPVDKSAGEWIGLAAIHHPKKVFNKIEKVLVEEHYNVYDTYAFTQLVSEGEHIKCLPTNEEPWIEIDFIEDYEKAKELFK